MKHPITCVTGCFCLALLGRPLRIPISATKKCRYPKGYLAEDKIERCSHPYRMRPPFNGFSPGLKNIPPECFLPCLRRCRPLRIPIRGENKNTTRSGGVFILAEDEGFEPPQTESESGVLPLHKSSMCQARILLYAKMRKCQELFSCFYRNFFSAFIWTVCPVPGILYLSIFFPGKGLVFQYFPAQITEGLLFTLVPEHGQDMTQLLSGFLVHQPFLRTFVEVGQR